MKLEIEVSLYRFCVVQFTVISATLLLAIASYVLVELTGHETVFGFVRVMGVDEQSIPTFVSVVNLLLASMLLFVIYGHQKNQNYSDFRYWLFLAALFLYLSIDELASIHENFSAVFRYLTDHGPIDVSFGSSEWIPFGIAFVLSVLLILLPFLKQLAADTLRNFVAAGAVFLAGALGFEYLGGAMLQSDVVESQHALTYKAIKLIEESFEMYGIAIFNCALFRECTVRHMSLTIQTETVD